MGGGGKTKGTQNGNDELGNCLNDETPETVILRAGVGQGRREGGNIKRIGGT